MCICGFVIWMICLLKDEIEGDCIIIKVVRSKCCGWRVVFRLGNDVGVWIIFIVIRKNWKKKKDNFIFRVRNWFDFVSVSDGSVVGIDRWL